MDDTDEQRPNYSPFTTQSLPRTGPSHSTQPWKSIPHHLLSIGSSSAGIRYFSSSTRQLSRHNNPFTEDQERDEEEDEEYDDEEHDDDEEAAATPKLTHVNQNGTAHMVSVGGKRATRRTAVAVASVRFSRPGPLRLIRANAVKKGDVLSVARIAGIMASKATPSVIPLCHAVNITHAEVEAGLVEPPPAPEDAAFDGSPEAWRERRRRAREERRQEEGEGEREGEEGEEELDRDFAALRRSTNARRYASSHFAPGDCRAVADRAAYPFGGVLLTARVETVGPTGVEMDALMAASAAALTVFDMCKAVDRAMRIENARVVLKTGGRSGDWVDAGWLYARAGVARRKELEGVMAWKGDLEAGAKDGKKWWKKCFRVLTRAGFDEKKAQELLRWIKDGTMGVAGVKGKGEGGDESGEGGGGEAVRVDEDEEPLWEGESDGGEIDFEESTEKTSEESSLGKEQASQATEQPPRNMPASSPVSTPQSTAETAAKKESRTKKPSLDTSQTPQTTQQSPQDVPASSSQPARQSTLPAAAEQSPQPAPETSAPPALEEDPEYIEARNIAKVIAAVEKRDEPLVLTPAMIRKMSATDIFADDELRSQKYRGMAAEEAKNNSQPAAEEATPEDQAVALDFAIKFHQALMVKKQMELERDAAEPSRQHATEEETDVDEDADDDDNAASTPPPPPSIHDLKKDRPKGSGRVLPTDIEPTPEEAALAQKSTAPPPWETMPPGPARVKAARQWRRDQEWNARMERLAALERRAEEARRRPLYSRHWLRARGGGKRMMRKVELAARIGVHDAEHDVLRWEPPGLDGGAEDEVSDADLRHSWTRFVKTEPPPENSREKGLPRKYRERHAVAREKEQLKRAMGRVDYNEWTLLSFIKGKRERRWDRERAVREEEEKSNEQAREALGLWDHLAGEDEFVEEENEGLEEGEERGRKESLEEAGRDYMEKWHQEIEKARR